jgi:ABC-2 type transport system permease protein
MLVVWAVTVIVFGVVIGSLVSSATDFLTSPNAQDLIKKLGGAQALTDAFLAAEIAIMGILVTAYGLSAANHLRSAETAGHAEPLLGTATTRTRWATSHYGAALAGVALLMLLTGLSTGVGAAFALHDGVQVGRVTLAALAQIPAA